MIREEKIRKVNEMNSHMKLCNNNSKANSMGRSDYVRQICGIRSEISLSFQYFARF